MNNIPILGIDNIPIFGLLFVRPDFRDSKTPQNRQRKGTEMTSISTSLPPELQAKVCQAELILAIYAFQPEALKCLTTADAALLNRCLYDLIDLIATRNLEVV